MGSSKKTPAKAGSSSVVTRRSASKVLKEETAVTPKNRSVKKRDATFSHHLPTEEQRKSNGRVHGRSLIVWGRPRMADKLLLHIQYECQRAKIDLPWNAIAHRLHPGSSGAAVNQYLVRLRRELVAEGHLVPPLPQTKGVDSSIRGYVREDETGDDKTTTRPVTFSEKLEDRRFSLPGAFNNDADTEMSTVDTDNFGFGNKMDDDPFFESESPTPFRRLFQTPTQNRSGFIDPSPSYDDNDYADFSNGRLPRMPFSHQRRLEGERDEKFIFSTPEVSRSGGAMGYMEPYTPTDMAPPVTPTRSRSATVTGSYGHAMPYYGPMSMPYMSPGHADHFPHTAMSPCEMHQRGNSYGFAPWQTLQPMSTQSPFDPRLQRYLQTETPTASPAEPLQDSQTCSAASVDANVEPHVGTNVESNVDELINFNGNA